MLMRMRERLVNWARVYGGSVAPRSSGHCLSLEWRYTTMRCRLGEDEAIDRSTPRIEVYYQDAGKVNHGLTRLRKRQRQLLIGLYGNRLPARTVCKKVGLSVRDNCSSLWAEHDSALRMLAYVLDGYQEDSHTVKSVTDIAPQERPTRTHLVPSLRMTQALVPA